jgi:hypothetical protein
MRHNNRRNNNNRHNGGRHHHNNGGHHNQQRRMNPRMQNFDSNGPDVRIRGNAFQVTEKYQALARDAASAGDRVLAESYLQHAEHYQRMLNEYASYEQELRAQQQLRGEEEQPQPYANGHSSPSAAGHHQVEISDNQAVEDDGLMDVSFLKPNAINPAPAPTTDDAMDDKKAQRSPQRRPAPRARTPRPEQQAE